MANWFVSEKPVMFQEGLFIIRLITGFFLFYHGAEMFDDKTMNGYLQWDMFKDYSSAKTMVYAGKAAELLAGAFVFFGLFTRLGAIIAVSTFLYIAFYVGHGKVWYDDQHPFLFVLLGLIFFFTGGGRWSLDHLLFNRKVK